MSFGHPLLLLTLLAIPAAIALYLLAERRRMRYAVTFTNLDVLTTVAAGERPWRRSVAPVLFLLSLAALCVALARPHRATLVPSNQATVILVIDVSGSMQATDVKPTRLQAAQQAAKQFLAEVPEGVKVGLVAFSGDPEVASVPTADRDAVKTSLDQLSFFHGFGGTAIGDALAAAVRLGKQSVPDQVGTAQTIASVSKQKSLVSILFLSDGKQTRGALQPLQGADLAKRAGIPVYTIALGTPNGRLTGVPFGNGFYGGGFGNGFPVPPDPATLKAIAEDTHGKFFAARSAEALHSAYRDLGRRLGRVPGSREVTDEFVAAAALLLLAAGVLGALWAPRLP